MVDGIVIDIRFNTMTEDIYIIKDRESWNDLYFGRENHITEWLGRNDWDNRSVFVAHGGKWLTPSEYDAVAAGKVM